MYVAHIVVDINRPEAQRQVDQYYTLLTLQRKEESWVIVFREGMPVPEGDRILNRKLACKWAGPFKFEGMANPVMAKLQHNGEDGQVILWFVVHAAKVRLYKCHKYYEEHQGPLL